LSAGQPWKRIAKIPHAVVLEIEHAYLLQLLKQEVGKK
jgi:hypothetical protein